MGGVGDRQAAPPPGQEGEPLLLRRAGRLEIDLVIERGADLTALEIKSARTPSAGHFAGFDRLAERLERRGDQRWRLARRVVVYAGEDSQKRSAGELVGWSDLPTASLWER